MTSPREGATCAGLWTFIQYHPALSCLYAIAVLAAVIGVWFPTEIAA